jgi:hypothetical protein
MSRGRLLNQWQGIIVSRILGGLRYIEGGTAPLPSRTAWQTIKENPR